MKVFHVRTGLILATVLVGSTAFAQVAANRISNSRHNFQAGGTGNIKVTDASQEDGICVFCHTPHQGRSSLLLWNRQMTPGADYSWDVTHTTAGTQYPTNLKAWSGSWIRLSVNV